MIVSSAMGCMVVGLESMVLMFIFAVLQNIFREKHRKYSYQSKVYRELYSITEYMVYVCAGFMIGFNMLGVVLWMIGY